MALNFPSSPTDGQQVVNGNVTWQWSASESVWNIVKPVAIPDAPADGSDYVRRNNVWVRTGQKVTYTNPLASVDMAVPTWAKKLKFKARLFTTSSSGQAPGFRFRANSTNFTAVGDYGLGGFTADAAAAGFTHYNNALTLSYLIIANTHSNTVMPICSEGYIDLELNSSSQNFSITSVSRTYTGTSILTSEFLGWLVNGKTSATRLDQVTLINSISANWQSGSYIDIEWLA